MTFTKCACIETLYTELPFLERFQAAKDDGFGAVEFWSWTDKDLDAARSAADSAGASPSPASTATQASPSSTPPRRRTIWLF